MPDIPIRLKPIPTCPDCGAQMVLRRPKPGGKPFRPFWSCSTWPDCDGKRQIGDDGLPEMDDDELAGAFWDNRQ